MIVVQNPSTAHAADVVVEAVPFAFSTTSPLILRTLAPGQIVDRAAVVIDTPLDGLTPTLQLGTFADPGGILDASQVDATRAGQYESDELVVVTVPDFLILTIAPGASAHGSGLVFYEVKI